MSSSDSPTKLTPASLTDAAFEAVRTLAFDRLGVTLADAKRELVYTRISRRLRKLKLDTFEEYIELVRSGDPDEAQEFINAITTNLTSFFREPHHFEFLGQTLLPRLMQEKKASRKIRIWCSAASTGQEPYSIAATVREAVPDLSGWDLKILATDIDTNVLDTARRGLYSEENVRDMDKGVLRRWFLRGKGSNAGKVKAHPALQELISFKRLNLLDPWPMAGPFDVIFCRNVMIYFDKPTQAKILVKFAQVQRTGMHLLMGHAENITRITEDYKLVGQTIYRRT